MARTGARWCSPRSGGRCGRRWSCREAGASEALRAGCTAVSAGTEIAIYSGSHIGYTIPGARYPRMPFHPGYAWAGTVEAVGPGVRGRSAGDRVLGSFHHRGPGGGGGGGRLLDLIPEGVTLEQACLACLATIAMQGVRLAQVRLGEGGGLRAGPDRAVRPAAGRGSTAPRRSSGWTCWMPGWRWPGATGPPTWSIPPGRTPRAIARRPAGEGRTWPSRPPGTRR